jgi:glucose-1-phosphatase
MAAPRIEVVVLDLGNVLVFHDNALLARRLAERAGAPVEPLARTLAGPLSEDINRGLLDAEGIRREVCAVLGADLPAAEFAALWSCHFTPYPQMLPRVRALAGRVRLLLLSNTNVLHWEGLRDTLPALRHFHRHLLSYQLGVAKPDRAIFEHALREGGAAPSATAFFDDLQPYVEAARAVGLRGRLFTDAETFDRQLHELGL